MGDYRDDYWKLAEAEGRFNQLQAGLRTLASTWVLAALAGLAFLLRGSETWSLHPALLVWIVAILTVIGLSLLWGMDQFVYQRLLSAPFLSGLLMEEAHPDLPPTRLLMFSGSSGGMSRYLRFYYFAPIALFWLLSVVALVAEAAGAFSTHGSLAHGARVALFALSGMVLAGVFCLRHLSHQVGTSALATSIKDVEALSRALKPERVVSALRASVEALGRRSGPPDPHGPEGPPGT